MHDPTGPTVPPPVEIDQNDRQPSSVTVRETDAKGRGVYSTRSIAEGEIVIVGKPVSVLPERAWYSLQTGLNTHVRVDSPFEFLNHCCEPNCGVKSNDHDGYDLVAMRNIEAEEEITFDYSMTEWICVGFKDCHCGSDRCRKTIGGAKFLSPEKLQQYDGYMAPYLRARLREHPSRSQTI